MCNLLVSHLFFFFFFFCILSRHGWFLAGFLVAERFISFIFHDLYFVSSDMEINFSLGQKQTVLLMCGLRGQLCIITSKEMLMAEFFLRYTVCHSIDAETDSMIGNFTDSMKRVLM